MTLPVAVRLLRDPAIGSTLSDDAWGLAIRQLRAANLLATLDDRLTTLGLANTVPAYLRWHFTAVRRLCDRHHLAVKEEIRELQRSLGLRGIPVVLLKGAAYVASNDRANHGRLFSDIDILVPKHALDDVEGMLRKSGWAPSHLSDYDQRYYREWSHELPPMQHVVRGTTLDIHHTIMPPTMACQPDADRLLADAAPLPDSEELYTLSPADKVLHSATHLFHDGELDHGLRDLVDLDSLLRQFMEDPGFWDRLLEHARHHQLSRPLFYALHYCRELLGTPVPPDVLARLADAAPSRLGMIWRDALFSRALLPDHASCDDAFTGFARWCLYVRSHYLRMPLYRLLPHLFYKGLIAPRQAQREADNAAQTRADARRIMGPPPRR